MLLGGLNAADTSTAAVNVLDAHGVKAAVSLPEAQHDAQGVLLDRRAYVFGGGQFSSDDHILSYDPMTDSVTQAGSLPTPTSDAAVAALAGTAYVVGGYDGQQALDTIIAWRPGSHPQLVARLPYGLLYAAVAASGGRLLIVGGSHDEAATTAILSFDPATHNVQHVDDLPSPITHAAAVALGSYVYILGGRGSAPDTQRAAIIAIDPTIGHSVQVGRLPQPLSDATAIPPRQPRVAGRGAEYKRSRRLRARTHAQAVAAGNWYWHLIAANGQKVATSGESFASKDNAKKAAENVKKNAGSAPIEEA